MSRCLLAVILMLSAVQVSLAQQPVNEELSYLYGDDDFVSIATGRKQLISKAPAVASVISAADIRAMGATDLNEVLKSVPGIHVSINSSAYNPVFVIRGIYSAFNPQVLVLINGIPVTHVYTGDRGQVWGGMPVENISRVEVIRGPGSAMYGAEALAGVINVITKTAAEIDGVETGAALEAFDTQRGWLLYGGEAAGWDVAFSLELLDTDGQSERVSADLQTQFDDWFATSASLAPGGVNTARESVDARIDVSRDEWQIRAGYQGRNKVGIGAGVLGALDPLGEASSERFNFDISYQTLEPASDWDVKATLSFFDTNYQSELMLLPPGAFGAFPEGMLGNPQVYERHYRLDLATFFNGIEDHAIRLGSGYHYLDQYRIGDQNNYTLPAAPAPPIPLDLGGVRRLSGDALFNEARAREVLYLFIQDEWQLAPDWSLVSGLRYDHFSDFGDTVNPRLALVWNNNELTTKLLYGRAFRAPSFVEQYNRNNPLALGNDQLDPEIINTYELAFDYAYSPDLRVGLNLFYYKMEDIIHFTPQARNAGDQVGKGFEFDVEWQLGPMTHLLGNYAFQHSRDKETGRSAANAPQQQLYVRLDRQLLAKWHLSSRVNWVAGRQRDAADTREDIADYATLDVTLMGKELMPGLSLSFSVFNVTDEKILEPSIYDPLYGAAPIPGDLPLAGRSLRAQIIQRW